MKLETIIARIKATKRRKPFGPKPVYNEFMDAVDVFWKDTGYYSHWLTPEVTLHKTIKGDEIIGVQICGISRLLPKHNKGKPRPF